MILRSKKLIEPKTIVSKNDKKSKLSLNASNTKEAELKENESFNLQLQESMNQMNISDPITSTPNDVSMAVSNESQVDASQKEQSINESNESDSEPNECKKSRAKYTKIETFDTYLELDEFIRSNNFYFIKITHNDFKPCTICQDDHNMKRIYLKCTCNKCNLK